MKRLIAIVFILVVAFATIWFFQARSCRCKHSATAESPELLESDLKEIDTKLSAVHTKFLNRENGNDVRNFKKWIDIVDRTEKVSLTEINEVKRAFSNIDRAGVAPDGARILAFDGETPTTTDILLLLSQQCNYRECPNVCVEDGAYFYAWREGDFRHGTLVDKQTLSVRSWNFSAGKSSLSW